MTLLPIIRTIRGIEIGLAGTEKGKHISWSLGLFLPMSLQEKLSEPTMVLCFPQTVEALQNFFDGPRLPAARTKSEMLREHLGERSALPRYSKKVQSSVVRSQTQKAFLLFLAHCKGWTWPASSFSSYTAWVQHNWSWLQPGVEVGSGLCWCQRPAVQLSSAQLASYSSVFVKWIHLHRCLVKWITPAYVTVYFAFPV